MDSIDGFSSNGALPPPVTSNAGQPVDPDQDRREGEKVSTILAKAALAAKRQIVARTGNPANAAPQPERPSSEADGSDSFPKVQRGRQEDESLVRNLGDIVVDDSRWELFARFALGLRPGTNSCSTVRDGLLKGFREGAWEGIADLVRLDAESPSTTENGGRPAPPDRVSAGLIERIQLWLKFPKYFEPMGMAVQEKNLSNNLNLYTDERLIKFLGTIGQ